MNNLLGLITICFLIISCKPEKKGTATITKPAPGETPISTISLEEIWSTPSSLLKTPESVLFDEELGVYYVSCIGDVPPTKEDNDGYIAKLDQRGNILVDKWAIDLDAPKGMAYDENVLYVTDINEFVLIDRKSGKTIERIPIKDSKFLNDVSRAPNGTVYFSDMSTNTIHTYSNGKTDVFLQNSELGGVNGLTVDHETIYASASNGSVNTIDRASKLITKRATGIKSGDGIEPWKGGYIVSSWKGEIWYVSSTWETTKVMDTKNQKINTADISINQKSGQLLVPTFFDNRVIAFDIK